MSDLHIDICDRLVSGQQCQFIAYCLNIPISWVIEVRDEMMNDFENCDFFELRETETE